MNGFSIYGGILDEAFLDSGDTMTVLAETPGKTCRHCKVSKVLDQFAPYVKGGNSRRNVCRACSSILNAQYRNGKKKRYVEPRVGIEKVCTKCNVEKDLSEFHRHSRRSDGRHTFCKSCRNSKSEK